MRNLAEEVLRIWQENRMDFEERLQAWSESWKRGEKKIVAAKKRFRQWRPLRLYTNVTDAPKAIFSMRFCGQEVGHIIVRKERVFLRLNDKHVKNNKKWFPGCRLGKGEYEWSRSSEAKAFRKFFKEYYIETNGFPKVKGEERRIESKFIEEMFNGSCKFGIEGLKVRPVTIGISGRRNGIPLQIPILFAPNKGKPVPRRGNIDILSRRKGKDNKTRLCVWELKRPGAYGHAASQATIYALTFICILRHTTKKEISNDWYKILGFKGKIPKRLEIEAIIAVDKGQKEKFEREKAKLIKSGSLKLFDDSVKLCAAYYIEESDSIKFINDPFTEE
jgi:hypothetical protein